MFSYVPNLKFARVYIYSNVSLFRSLIAEDQVLLWSVRPVDCSPGRAQGELY